MVQPPDYYLAIAMQAPTPRHHLRELPARPKGPSLLERFRVLVLRTTLGPRTGDHVLGDGQWDPRPATR